MRYNEEGAWQKKGPDGRPSATRGQPATHGAISGPQIALAALAKASVTPTTAFKKVRRSSRLPSQQVIGRLY